MDGTLRISGRDAMGQPFTIRRTILVIGGDRGGVSGVSAATCRTSEPTKLLAVPLSVWQTWWQQFVLAEWLESHPQREDLMPLLALAG